MLIARRDKAAEPAPVDREPPVLNPRFNGPNTILYVEPARSVARHLILIADAQCQQPHLNVVIVQHSGVFYTQHAERWRRNFCSLRPK
jgi:hypothetical protein